MMRFRTRKDRADRTPPPAVDAAHRVQLAARLAQATPLAADDAVRARIEASPAGYALAHAAGDIARHATLLQSLPSMGEVRVVSTPGREPGTWNLDIAAFDQPGLLAKFTGVLVHESIEIVRAVLATWDDGAALQALIVKTASEPDVVALQRALAWSLDQGMSAPPVDGTRVYFDQHASSVYTACTVTGPDRPGLLHAIAVAITNAGADIHAAAVETQNGLAVDRFDLTDAAHRKLAPGVRMAIARNVQTGFSGSVARR